MHPSSNITPVILLLIIFKVTLSSGGVFEIGKPFDTTKCSLPSSLVEEIRGYKSIANSIFNEATENTFKGKTYEELRNFVDTFGPRPAGSAGLEGALTYLEHKLTEIGLEDVHAENVNLYKLIRKVEFATMHLPYELEIQIVGTGSSVSTPPFGITKDIHFVPIGQKITSAVKDTIVVFDDVSVSYDSWKVAQLEGAAAILLRGNIYFSISTLFERQGEQLEDRQIFIPMAFITNEDVDFFGRVSARGQRIQLTMNIQQELFPAISRNVIGEMKGKTKPEEFVIISGHADTWDLSEGASDDGVGVILSFQVQQLLRKLNLAPKRTLRTVVWTGEETGFYGSLSYAQRHMSELRKMSTVLEADGTCFGIQGFTFGGSAEYGCILQEILNLMEDTVGGMRLKKVNTTWDKSETFVPPLPTDVSSFFPADVPGANLNGDTKDHKLFWYRHTYADTMSVVSSTMLDKCLAVFATTAYVAADLDNAMPRV